MAKQNDVLEKLARCKTEHPGGYSEIYQALAGSKKKALLVTFPRVEVDGASTYPRHEEWVPGCDVAEEIAHAVAPLHMTGDIATAVVRTLHHYNLPIPGDEHWMEPAASWLRE